LVTRPLWWPRGPQSVAVFGRAQTPASSSAVAPCTMRVWNCERKAWRTGDAMAISFFGSLVMAWRRQLPRRAPGYNVRILLIVLSKPSVSTLWTRYDGSCWNSTVTVRFSCDRLAVCPKCHPQVIRSRKLKGYHGGDVLKYQENREGCRPLPRNAMECERFQGDHEGHRNSISKSGGMWK
jgi:hypothetical protein